MSEKLDKIRKTLFVENSDIVLTPKEEELRMRYRDLYTQMLSHPFKTDSSLVAYLEETYELSKTQSYRDIAAVKVILGDVKNAGKEFQRFAAIEMIKRGFELVNNEAADKLDIHRAETMIRAGMALGKVTRLDKEDAKELPWDEIVPQNFEISGDVSVIGRKRIPDLEERKRKLRAELFGDIHIQEAEIVDDERESD